MAFLGFQMGAGGDMNFQQYLEKIGLMESTTPEKPQKSAKELIEWAESLRNKQ